MQYRLHRTSICPLGKNLPAAFQQPSVIDETLQKECEAGRILGPFPTPPLPNYGVQHLLHYLDDFFTVGPADSDICEQSLNATMQHSQCPY